MRRSTTADVAWLNHGFAQFGTKSGDDYAGHALIEWHSKYPPFQQQGIPETVDLNVAPGESYRVDDALVLYLIRQL